MDGVRITRLLIPAAFGTGIQNFPALFRWQWGELLFLIRNRKRFDIFHACDFDTVIPATIIKFLWGKKVVYDIFDFYADHLRNTPGWIKRIIRWMDQKCIDWVDGVILADDARWEQIRGANPKRNAVIYNTPNDTWHHLKNEPVSQGNDFRLAYVGLLQVERGILEFLDVIARHPGWSLDLAGFGGDSDLIQEQAEGMSNVKLHGKIPYQKALEICSQADVLFATYDPIIPNHRYASPNKVFEAMMLGKPIIVARGTNMDSIIERYECGLVVDYGDALGLETVLSTLKNDHKLRLRLGKNARQAYDSVYNWHFMESRLLNLYESL
jgi:glycosyltransferase involved in cell wall biosynthesis